MNKQIQDTERIDRFFTRLRLESRPIVLRSALLETRGLVINTEPTLFTVLYQGNFHPSSEAIHFQFSLDKDYYFGEVEILRKDHKHIVLKKPDTLDNRSIRKYPRVFVRGKIKAKFHIISDVSHEPDTRQSSAPPKLIAIYEELQKPVPDIKKVLVMIGKELHNISLNSEIKLQKDGQKYSEEVGIINEELKPFWIADTRNAKDYIKVVPTHDVINYAGFFKKKKLEGWTDDQIKEEIILKQQRYQQKGILSVAAVPIMLYQNVIGHILVLTSRKSMQTLRVTDVYYIKALADIASEALAKARLFELKTGTDFDVPVYNISAGGAYIEVSSQFIIKYLHEKMHLMATIKLDSREIETISEIRRIDFIGQDVRLAIKFLEIKPADQTYIERFVQKQIEFSRKKEDR